MGMAAIFKSLKTLIPRSPTIQSRSFFALSLSSSIPTPFLLPASTTQPYIRRHFLCRSRFLSPLWGPLFLSSPPWKLSQSATPLLLRSDLVLALLKRRALLLLTRRPAAFTYTLGYHHRHHVPTTFNHAEQQVGYHHPEIDDAGVVLRQSYLNLPNSISFARLLSGPLLGWMIMHDMYSAAFIGLAISGASDWLDGFVARKMQINSVVGSYLDPLADKVLIGCVALAMVDSGLLHLGLVGIVVLRDVALVGGAVYKRASDFNWERNNWRDFFNLDGAYAQKVEPLFISKVNTVFQLGLVAAALLQPEFGNSETLVYINYLSWLVASTTVASTAAYGIKYWRKGGSFIKSSTGS